MGQGRGREGYIGARDAQASNQICWQYERKYYDNIMIDKEKYSLKEEDY